VNHADILSFWFNEIKPSQWWVKNREFDALIVQMFSAVHKRANNCELFEWRRSAKGRLAEILVLDQFSRNMYRDSPQAFLSDPLALALSQEAITAGHHKELNDVERNFLYMPFMHSESLPIHNVALKLYKDNGVQATVDFEIAHRKIIAEFGRYPHRNAVLQRVSTAEEVAFLERPGSSF
jgi:uncharacterized protein (DUF924 family)